MNERSPFLLVEDNDDDAYFMQRALRKAGLSNPLQRVTDGDQAVAYLGGEGAYGDRDRFPFPHLVFLDLKLPGRDGFDVLTFIRGELNSAVPVTVLTSSPEEVDRQRARELGANDYLVKPPTADVIIDCCRRFGLNCS